MNFAFAGFRHGHVNSLYKLASTTDEVNIVGAWEENEPARKAAEENLGVVFTYEKYEDMLNDPNVDVVVLGNYYGARGQMGIDALNAGKHIIGDKPLCTSLDELNEIEKLAADKNLKVGCMLDLRNTHYTHCAREIIQSGKLGEIHNILFEGQHALMYGKRASWYFEKGKHGGTINDIAIHGIDLVRYITGLELEEVLAARTWNAFATEEPDFKDCGQFMTKLSNGAGLMADVSYAAPQGCEFNLPFNWRFVFWGTKGVMEFSHAREDVYIAYEFGAEPVVLKPEKPANTYLDDFLSDIKGKKVDFNTAEVIASTRTALTIQAAADK